MGGPHCLPGLFWGAVMGFLEWMMKGVFCLHQGCKVSLDLEKRLLFIQHVYGWTSGSFQ